MTDATLPSRSDALALMESWTPSDSLRKHMLSVEGAMRAYAAHFGEDIERWGLAGLMHDFDYERYPNDAHAADAEHPSEGVRVLRGLGYPEDVLQAILGHAHYTGVARETRMAKALFAVDELCGMVTSSGGVIVPGGPCLRPPHCILRKPALMRLNRGASLAVLPEKHQGNRAAQRDAAQDVDLRKCEHTGLRSD